MVKMQAVFASAIFHIVSLKQYWLQGTETTVYEAVDEEGTAGCVWLVEFTQLRGTDKEAGSEQARSPATIRERTERV